MTWDGWLTMTISISVVTGLLVWCVYKVMRTPGESEKIHGFERREARDDDQEPQGD